MPLFDLICPIVYQRLARVVDQMRFDSHAWSAILCIICRR
jgi:hypothetical protein